MERPTANLIINAKKTHKTKNGILSPLNWEQSKDVYLFLPLPLDIVLVVLANSIGTYENKCT